MPTTTITGIGSGFDIDSWVSQLVAAKKSSTVTPLQTKLDKLNSKNTALDSLETKFKSLKSSLETFTKTLYGYSDDMWAKTSITSSNDSYATATSTGSVASGSINLEIEQIATATSAKSANSLGVVNSENADSVLFKDIANGLAKTGTFSLFLNNKEYQIDITDEDTFGSIKGKIEAQNDKLKMDINDDGTIKIYSTDENASLVLGSNGDKSNFASVLKLNKEEGKTNSYSSGSYSISTFNADKSFGSGNSGLGDIKFEDGSKITINGVDFDVDENTTINKLISKINGNSDVNAKASYDSLTNKFILTSTQTGQYNISLGEEGTNLLQKLGLTEDDGEGGEKLKDGSQTLGQNAIAYVNGNKVVSASNTITGESSGISNLSVTIKKPTSTYSGDDKAEKNITLDIEPDYTSVKDALKTFVNAYNDVVTTTKSAIASDGSIGTDSSLNSILAQLRGITSMVGENDGSLSMLSEIGISTTNTDTSKLSIDDTKLEKALKENFDSVKALLSDGKESKVDNGLFDRLLTNVSDALDSSKGYFANKSTSIDSQITSLNKRIERANTLLTSYETRITKQFNNMDSIMSSLSSQLSAFQSYFS